MDNMLTTTRVTVSMKLFAFFYALFGIRIDYDTVDQRLTPMTDAAHASSMSQSKRKSRFPFYAITRCLLLFAFVLFVAGITDLIIVVTPEKPSLLDFIKILYHLTSFVIILYGGLTLSFYASTLSQILFSPDGFARRFYRAQFVYPLMLSVPSFLVDIHDAIQTFLSDRAIIVKVGQICGLYVWQVQYALVCMYIQCEAVVYGQLRDVTELIRTISMTRESAHRVTKAKSSIRTVIKKINLVFGNVLLVCYLKIFTLITLRLGTVILWGTNRSHCRFRDMAYVLTACIQIAQIFETTRLGSRIIVEAQNAERTLYAPRKCWLDDDAIRVVTELRSVLFYRDQLDALTISDSFVNRKTTMFTYLGTMFTFIAIIIQFDYDIMRVQDAAKSAPYTLARSLQLGNATVQSVRVPLK